MGCGYSGRSHLTGLMNSLYQKDLAYIQAAGFGDFARAAAPEIVRALRAVPVPVHRVVEVGCGAGPLTTILAQEGFKVVAIDVSAELLSVAQAACPRAELRQGSIYEQEIPACEAILAIGEPLTYHDSGDADSRVRGFFRRAANTVPEGGLLIFDVVELGEPPLSGRFWKSGDDWAVLVDTQEDQSSRVLKRRIETFRRIGDLYRRGAEVHRVRLFDTAELCAWLQAAGFIVTTAVAYGDFSLSPRRRAFFCTRTQHSHA